MKPTIKLSNVSKSYNLYERDFERLRNMLSFKKNSNCFYALNNVSFEAYAGEVIGIIGTNGAGKSTLSKILAQVIPATSGSVEINGESSLVAIKSGLNKNLTGLENIQLKCLMYGLDRHQIEQETAAIIEIADIGEFITQPVKIYSSGMKSRLGFAISTRMNPDILIIDEALAVGDKVFFRKFIKQIKDFKDRGKTIFFVSHSLRQIEKISDRALWLNFGQIQDFGDTSVVAEKYKQHLEWLNGLSKKEKRAYRKKFREQQADQQQVVQKSIQKDKNKFLLQALAVAIMMTLAAVWMFGLFSSDPDENVLLPEVINKPGVVQTSTIEMFADEELTKKIEELSFAMEVRVIEKIGKIAKIEVNDQVGYVDEKALVILDDVVK